MLDCKTIHQLIANSLDHDLTVELQDMVEQHLASCSDCEEDYRSLAKVVQRLNDLTSTDTVAPWFAQRTLDRIVTEFRSERQITNTSPDPNQLALWTQV